MKNVSSVHIFIILLLLVVIFLLMKKPMYEGKTNNGRLSGRGGAVTIQPIQVMGS